MWVILRFEMSAVDRASARGPTTSTLWLSRRVIKLIENICPVSNENGISAQQMGSLPTIASTSGLSLNLII